MEVGDREKVLQGFCRDLSPSTSTNLLREIEQAILKQYDLNCPDETGNSLLCLLCTSNESEKSSTGNLSRLRRIRRQCIEKLLSPAAAMLVNINSQNLHGWNAIMVLCRDYEADDFVSLARLLMLRGIELNHKTSDGWTPLIALARFFGNSRNEELIDVVRLFIDNGALADITCDNGWTPLLTALRYYQRKDLIDVVRLLLRCGAQANHRTPEGHNSLLVAAQYYHHDNLIKIINILLEAGADITCKTKDNWNALMLVCSCYEANDIHQVAELLLLGGVNVNDENNQAWTALHISIRYFGNVRNERLSKFVRLLLIYGAKADVSNSDGYFPIHLACIHYDKEDLIEVIKLLIQNGAQVDSHTPKGLTALILLIQNYHQKNLVEILSLLVRAGANLNCKDNNNWNALLTLCRYNGNHPRLKEAISLLVKEGVDVDHSLLHSEEKQEELRNAGRKRTSPGWNALLLLIRHHNGRSNLFGAVEALIEAGIDLNFRNGFGWNALMFLCRFYRGKDFLSILEVLLRNGIDVDCKSYSDEMLDRPLDAISLICKAPYDGDDLIEIINILLMHQHQQNEK